MPIQPIVSGVVPLGDADTEILPATPSGAMDRLDYSAITNRSGSPVRFSIHMYLDGGSPAASNALFWDVEIQANSTWTEVLTPLTLGPGWKLSGRAASAGRVNVTLTGLRRV